MQRALRLLILGLFIHLAASVACAEPRHGPYDADYLIHTWETEEGLPENSATAMVQTPDGRLLFGSFGGLVSFDGVDFEVLHARNTPALPSSGIVNLHMDRTGRLWVSTYGGLLSFHNGTWRRYTAADGWKGDFVRVFAERENGDMLMSTFDRQIFEYSGGRLASLPLPPGRTVGAKYVLADEEGRWWTISGDFVGRWSGDEWVVAENLREQAPEAWGGKARDGGFWLYQNRTLTKVNHGIATETRTLPESPGGVWGIHEDSAGHVWVTTHDRGVCRVDAAGNMRRFAAGRGLAANGVRFVHEDPEGNLWIGTSGGGLTRFTPRRFRSVGIESGIEQPNIKSISASRDGGVWIATYGSGLRHFDGVTQRPVPEKEGFVPNVQSVLEDRTGCLWVGFYSSALAVIDGEQSRKIDDQSNGGGNGIALFEDSSGRIWVSGGQHVAVHDNDRHQVYGNEPAQPLWGTFHFAQTTDGAIWAMNQKLHKLVGDRFEVQYDPAQQSRISSMVGDPDGSLWIGTEDGLIRWRDGKMDRVDARHGLKVAGVHGIIADKLGHYWLATSMGIVRVLREDLHAAADGTLGQVRARHFDRADGLPSVHCSAQRQPVCAMDMEGRVWFATLKGAVFIDPAALRLSQTPPTVRFKSVSYLPRDRKEETQIDLDPGALTKQAHAPSRTIVIPPGGRRITVRFAASSLTTTRGVEHEVQFDSEPWQSTGHERQLSLYELSPGVHVLNVRARNHDGVWSATTESLAITVMPYFWQTFWFRTAALMAIVGLSVGGGWWLVHRRHRHLREEQERFERLVEASPTAMLMIDEQGTILLTNVQARQHFGGSEEQLRQAGCQQLLPGLNISDHWRSLCQNAGRGEAARGFHAGEPTARRVNGQSFPAEVRLSAVQTTKGVFLLVSVNDVSERHRVEQEMQQQRNELAHLSRVSLLGELSGSMAHELNQPLASILSNAQAAQRFMDQDQPDLAEVRDILKDIVDEDKRAGEVIRRLRLLLKKGEVQLQPLSINEVVLEVLRLVRTDLINHGVQAFTDLSPDLPLIKGDRVQLQQVLLNLMINACDAMRDLPASQRIMSVSTSALEPSGIHLQVTDQGSGIPSDQLETIFEPFITTKASGMGLGLAVCRTIVTAHGGTLWASNSSQGGAILHLILPTGRGGP